MREHDYDTAIADANAGIEKDANLALCHFVRGDAYVEKGEFQEAVKELSVGLDLKPGNPEALSRRGKAHEHLGERDLAIADFRAALVLAPDLVDARTGLNRLTTP